MTITEKDGTRIIALTPRPQTQFAKAIQWTAETNYTDIEQALICWGVTYRRYKKEIRNCYSIFAHDKAYNLEYGDWVVMDPSESDNVSVLTLEELNNKYMPAFHVR